MRNSYEGLIDDWKVQLITQRAERRGFRPDEMDDVQQEIVLALMAFRYDPDNPTGATERTAVTALIDKQLASMIRARARRQRATERYANHVAAGGEGQRVHQHDCQRDLRHDIGRCMRDLPARDRAVCNALSRDVPHVRIAKDLGITRYELDSTIRRLRIVFRSRGLGAPAGEYLQVRV